jgi:phosphoglycolate phosphatase-like HAD superfamily hydrolase
MMFVFDFDGVLVDSSKAFLGLLRQVHAEMAAAGTVPDDLWDQLDDITFPAMAAHLQVSAARRGDFLRRLLALMNGDYRPEPFAGIDGVLRALARRGPVAILSASPGAVIESALARAGLSEAVAAIRDGRDPAGKAVKLPALIDQFGVPPGAAVMIGDAVSDVRAGQVNGVPTAAVTWGWQSAERLRAAGPDWLFSRVEALLELPDLLAARARAPD